MATNGRDIARFAVPDGPGGPAGVPPAGPNTWTGFSPTGAYRVQPAPPSDGRHPAPPRAEPRPQHRVPPPNPQLPSVQESSRNPVPPDGELGVQHRAAPPVVPGGPPTRRVHSDVPPPRRTGPDDAPHTACVHPAPIGVGYGTDEPVDQPTVPNGVATDAEEAALPGPRRRRRAGGLPDERPASTYREQASAGGRKSRGGKRRRSTFWKELPILIVVALLLTFLIQTFVAKVYVIPSGSMETTLHGCTGCQNDRVLVDKITYRFSDPQPGDVVVFRGPDGWTSEFTAEEPNNIVVRALQGLGSLIGLAPPDEKDFIKRVIAVGGQTVQCCDSRNRVLVNGKPLDEPYIYFLPEAGTARQDAFGPVTVPAGTLWMMGDSRNNSADSRVPGHGPVPISNVIGRARFIVLPLARIGVIPSPNPQATTAALGAGDAGAPVALGMIGLLPLVVWRRRERELGEFLPRRRT